MVLTSKPVSSGIVSSPTFQMSETMGDISHSAYGSGLFPFTVQTPETKLRSNLLARAFTHYAISPTLMPAPLKMKKVEKLKVDLGQI